MKSTILTILKLIKPKYYNIVTGTLITCATSLLTKPLWLSFINWGIESTNENYTRINLPLIEEYDWIVGLIVIIITLVWHTANRILDLQEDSTTVPAYINSHKKYFETLEELCQEIYPILIDNDYIFKTVGPTSTTIDQPPLRTDFTIWYKYRSETILPNNSKIKELLNNNQKLFSRTFQINANKMILHIDTFEEHVKNEDYEYTEFRFPSDFKEEIEIICYKAGTTSAIFLKKQKWINTKLNRLSFNEWYFMGSSLLTPKKANDFDLVIYVITTIDEKTIKAIDDLKFDFKIKFKTEIHITLFIKEEKNKYQDFLKLNRHKLKGNG